MAGSTRLGTIYVVTKLHFGWVALFLLLVCLSCSHVDTSAGEAAVAKEPAQPASPSERRAPRTGAEPAKEPAQPASPSERRAPRTGAKPANGSARVLRVGTSPDYPPLSLKRDGKIVGIEVDFSRELATELDARIELVETPFDQLIPALLDRRIDIIMSGMSITAERRRLVTFTQPYLRVGQMAVIRAADLERFRDPEAMRQPSARVGFQTDTTGEDFARKSLALADLKGYPGPEQGLAALRAGEIDFFIHDAPTIWRWTGNIDPKSEDLAGRYRLLTTEYLAWAVRQEDTQLQGELNAILERWEQEDRIDSVLDDWIRVRKVTVEVAPPS